MLLRDDAEHARESTAAEVQESPHRIAEAVLEHAQSHLTCVRTGQVSVDVRCVVVEEVAIDFRDRLTELRVRQKRLASLVKTLRMAFIRLWAAAFLVRVSRAL
jgi:hypothetical protein